MPIILSSIVFLEIMLLQNRPKIFPIYHCPTNGIITCLVAITFLVNNTSTSRSRTTIYTRTSVNV